MTVMRILPFLLVLAWLAPELAHAQFITGRILHETTRAAVQGADVALFDSGDRPRATIVSDSAGRFRFTVGPGQYTLRIRHIAFAEYHSANINVERNETVDLEVRLGETIIPLEPLIVTARTVDLGKMAGFNDRLRNNNFGRFITRTDIDRRGAMRTTDLLRSVPGVTITPIRVRGRATTERYLVTMRGGGARTCEPAFYIDGVRVRQAADATIDDVLAPDMLEGVEVYSSSAGAPAQYSDPASCGVVLFWTREGEPGGRFSWKRLLVAVGAVAALIILLR
jgi:hypothetical protein